MGRRLKKAYRGTKALPQLIQNIAKEALPEEGHLLAHLMLSWSQIVGEAFQNVSLPEKITYNPHTHKKQLRIIIENASSAFLMKYQEEQIRERLLTYFGEQSIEKITFKQGKIPHKTKHIPVENKTPPQETPATKNISSDEKLHLALEKLKKSIK